MTRWTLKLAAFLASLLIGAAAASLFLVRYVTPPDTNASLPDVSLSPSFTQTGEFVAEFTEIEFDERTKYASMEMEFVRNGEIARCTSNPAEDEKDWLVLFNRKGKFSIEKRKVNYGKVERTDFGSFSKLQFDDSHLALLMMTDQGTVKPGRVTTEYLKRPLSDDGMELHVDGLSDGDVRNFRIGKLDYRGRMTRGTLTGGHRIHALVLEGDGKSQIIWYKSYFFPENIGELEWVGDLDGDEKLDLMFYSYASNGGQLEGFLFLSSFAVDDNLVGFAGFYTARCTS